MINIFQLFALLMPAFFYAQPFEINENPEQYMQHIVSSWQVDPQKIVYITNETDLEDLATVMHNSVLAFVQKEQSTSAEILDGKREKDPDACGLALNNLELQNVYQHLKNGNDYTSISFKKLKDNEPYFFSDKLTAVLIYSKRIDAFIADYFKVLKDFEHKNVDYVIVVFDNEITSQIPGAISNEQ